MRMIYPQGISRYKTSSAAANGSLTLGAEGEIWIIYAVCYLATAARTGIAVLVDGHRVSTDKDVSGAGVSVCLNDVPICLDGSEAITIWGNNAADEITIKAVRVK